MPGVDTVSSGLSAVFETSVALDARERRFTGKLLAPVHSTRAGVEALMD